MGNLRRSAAPAVLIAVVILFCAAGAQANTVTLGSQPQGPLIGGISDGGAGTVANTALPSPLIAAAPSDGTLTEWRFSADDSNWIPQVVHPVGGGLYTEGARGPAQQGTTVGPVVGPFPLNLPVKQGDLFGVVTENFAALGVSTGHDGAVYGYWVPPLTPGPGRAPDFGGGGSGAEYALSATLRFCLVPTLKGKKPKAAKKALKAADCTFGGKKKSKKRRKKKKVVGQSVAAGSSISDTAPVAIKVSRPKK
jgi:hypothetical protein